MNQNLIDLSKQGDLEAIAHLMNRSLKSKGTTAKIVLKDGCLKVLLEAASIPSQKILAPYVLRAISSLAIPSVEILQIYGRLTGDKNPTWTQAFNLDTPKLQESQASSIKSLDDINQNEGIVEPKPIDNLVNETHSGNLAALEHSLNQMVDDESVTINVEKRDNLLKITAKTDKFLDGQVFAKTIHQELKKFDLVGIETIEIYKQKLKGSYGFKIKSFSIAESESRAFEAEQALPGNTPASSSGKQIDTSAPRLTDYEKSRPKTEPKPKIQIGHLIKVGFMGAIALFAVITMIRRMMVVMVLSPAFGYFSVILAIGVLWRAWSVLNPFLQMLLRAK